jgi:hypothetical protein
MRLVCRAYSARFPNLDFVPTLPGWADPGQRAYGAENTQEPLFFLSGAYKTLKFDLRASDWDAKRSSNAFNRPDLGHAVASQSAFKVHLLIIFRQYS